MPTQRFLKLKDEKKRVILEAAVHEFSRVPYSAASINQIIKEAGISRGSFYTYFADKDDLMQYMLRGFRDSFQDKVIEALKKEEGNPFAVPVNLLKAVMKKGENGLGYKMYKNILSDLNMVNQNYLFGIRGVWLQDEDYQEFCRRFYGGIDKNTYAIQEELLPYFVDMAMVISMKALALYYKNVVERERLLKVVEKEMLVLEKGVCK